MPATACCAHTQSTGTGETIIPTGKTLQSALVHHAFDRLGRRRQSAAAHAGCTLVGCRTCRGDPIYRTSLPGPTHIPARLQSCFSTKCHDIHESINASRSAVHLYAEPSPKLPGRLVVVTLLRLLAVKLLLRSLALLCLCLLPHQVALAVALHATAHRPAEKVLPIRAVLEPVSSTHPGPQRAAAGQSAAHCRICCPRRTRHPRQRSRGADAALGLVLVPKLLTFPSFWRRLNASSGLLPRCHAMLS